MQSIGWAWRKSKKQRRICTRISSTAFSEEESIAFKQLVIGKQGKAHQCVKTKNLFETAYLVSTNSSNIWASGLIFSIIIRL